MVDASGYFKTAASHIRRGIEAKYSEIAELRHSLENKQSETNKHIQDTKQTIAKVHTDIARAQEQQNDPNSDRADKLKYVSKLMDSAKTTENDTRKEREQINAKIKAIEADLINLEQQAKSLESKS